MGWKRYRIFGHYSYDVYAPNEVEAKSKAHDFSQAIQACTLIFLVPEKMDMIEEQSEQQPLKGED